MDNVIAPILLAILGGFALFGLLVLGVMGVVSFFRAWERGEPEFSASMPRQTPDHSPLNSLEAQMARGELTESERQRMLDEVDSMLLRREAERRRIEERGSSGD